MALLKIASDENGYDLNLGEIAAIWRAGCIIRASFLSDIKQAFDADPELSNLLLAPYFTEAVDDDQQAVLLGQVRSDAGAVAIGDGDQPIPFQGKPVATCDRRLLE